MEKFIFRIGMSPIDSNKKIGPIRSHLYNYAFAKEKAAEGKDSTIIFRIDDTAGGEQTKEKARELFDFFSNVLGFRFDVTPGNAYEKLGYSVFQSERQAIYLQYLEKLYDEHIAFIDKSGLVLFDIKKFIERYTDVIEIEDLVLGKIKFNLKNKLTTGQRFFPLMRSNQSALYHLASVVDDADFGVTHVVRGQDKLSIVDLQEAIRIAFGFKPKKYLHTPLLLNTQGKMLAGAVKFDDFINEGITSQALISYLISSGYGDPNAIYSCLEEFIIKFDHKKIHTNNGKFDADRLKKINENVARKMPNGAYLDSFFLYLEKKQEKELREILENDRELCQILAIFRRCPSESVEILKSILQPYYDPPSQQSQNIIEKILSGFKEEEIVIPKEMLAKQKKQFFDGLRWILVGKQVFPDIEVVYQYLRSKKLLNLRVKAAGTVYFQHKQSEKDNSKP